MKDVLSQFSSEEISTINRFFGAVLDELKREVPTTFALEIHRGTTHIESVSFWSVPQNFKPELQDPEAEGSE